MPSMATIPNPDKGLHQLAEACALKLGNTELSVAERCLSAQQLRPLISIILLPNARAEQEDRHKCLHTIVEEITQAILSLLDLGHSFRFADAKVNLDLAYDLMRTLDELASSDTIAIVDKAPLIEAAEILIEPALRCRAPDRSGPCRVRLQRGNWPRLLGDVDRVACLGDRDGQEPGAARGKHHHPLISHQSQSNALSARLLAEAGRSL